MWVLSPEPTSHSDPTPRPRESRADPDLPESPREGDRRVEVKTSRPVRGSTVLPDLESDSGRVGLG